MINESSISRIKESQWGNYLLNEGDDIILFEMDKQQIPELNRFLVDKGINVISLRPKHSLEDIFLSLTAQ